MICKICSSRTDLFAEEKIMRKYQVSYFRCISCGFIQTEEPYWLEESYKEAQVYDTGMLSRNISFSKIIAPVIYFLFNKESKFLDFGGGYGIFTRLMRDIGFDFYWHDPYCVNLLAGGFDYNVSDPIELITSFETFEHFAEPIKEIENMLKISKNICFSTFLLPDPPPVPKEWWYYSLLSGRHISFYTLKSLQYIAEKFNLYLYTNKSNLHLLTSNNFNKLSWSILVKYSRFGITNFIKSRMIGKTINDMKMLEQKTEEEK